MSISERLVVVYNKSCKSLEVGVVIDVAVARYSTSMGKT